MINVDETTCTARTEGNTAFDKHQNIISATK